MKMNTVLIIVAAAALAVLTTTSAAQREPSTTNTEQETMKLGGFSVSLAVKDLGASRAFYEKLGFRSVGGNAEHNWLIMRNGTTTIGLFQGMFEKNILTFNPGWTDLGEEVESFQDVRDIQANLKAAGVSLLVETSPDGDGPAHIVMQDPDGNQIMLDQHVGKPAG